MISRNETRHAIKGLKIVVVLGAPPWYCPNFWDFFYVKRMETSQNPVCTPYLDS